MVHAFAKKVVYPIRKPLRQIQACFRRFYYSVRFSWPVWFYVINRKGRALYKNHQTNLNPTHKEILKDIQANGFAVTHIDELFQGEDWLPILQLHVQRLLPSARPRRGKKYLHAMWEEEPVIDLVDPFMQLAFKREVLEIVGGYFEVFGKCKILQLEVTEVASLGAPRIQAQQWHRDPDDKKICKMFLYLTDVDILAGPLMYVSGSHYGGQWRGVYPQQLPTGSYPPSGGVEKHIPSTDIREFVGKAGTVIFVDTSGLHRGGYAIKRTRTMFTASYTTEASTWSQRFRHKHNADELYATLNNMARYALLK